MLYALGYVGLIICASPDIQSNFHTVTETIRHNITAWWYRHPELQ